MGSGSILLIQIDGGHMKDFLNVGKRSALWNLLIVAAEGSTGKDL